MPKRMLLSGDEPGVEIGAVSYYEDTGLVLDGAAESVFANMVDVMGEDKFGEAVIADGWSNGYLWLGDVMDSDGGAGDDQGEGVSDGGGQSTAGE